MQAVLHAHIPGLRLVDGDMAFASGRLSRLPFQAWTQLESEYAYVESHYTRSAPVFWIRALDTQDGPDAEAIISRTNAAINPVHAAFLLEPGAPLMPTPVLSSCYVTLADDGDDSAGGAAPPVMRLIGPMERELIAFGSPLTYPFDQASLARISARHDFLQAHGVMDLDDEIGAGLSVLEETARPDSWYGGDMALSMEHGFVRCMAACESLLLGSDENSAKGEITQTFGRHAAALLALSPQAQEELARQWADLYRLRSVLMHGRSGKAAEDPAVDAQLAQGRRLLVQVLTGALRVRAASPDAPPLWSLLAQCCADPQQQTALTQAIAQGGAV